METDRAYNRVALAIMAKAPLEGSAKTRMVPPLAPGDAAELSRCFIGDMAENIGLLTSDPAVRGYVAYTPPGQESAFDGLLAPDFRLLPQRGAAFGDRLRHVVEDLLAAGHDAVFLVNSDSPDLPTSLLRGAVAALNQLPDGVVLGPAADGGYYLIGLKKCHSLLFSGIDWSTERVLAQTLARAAEIPLPVHLLPVWYDIDDVTSLRAFRDGSLAATDGLIRFPAPRTRTFLDRLSWSEGRPHAGSHCDKRL